MDLQGLSLSVLAGLLLAASVSDARSRRIPNALVLYGSLLGLILQTLAPTGAGLVPGGAAGLPAALLGGLAGLALFMPLHALRILGAGDVKLLGMAGVWLGAAAVVHAALWTLMAGGLLALVAMLHAGTLRPVLANVLAMLAPGMAPHGGAANWPQGSFKLPYAVAIAMGSAAELARLATAAT